MNTIEWLFLSFYYDEYDLVPLIDVETRSWRANTFYYQEYSKHNTRLKLEKSKGWPKKNPYAFEKRVSYVKIEHFIFVVMASNNVKKILHVVIFMKETVEEKLWNNLCKLCYFL